ncbi:MAG: HEAT repeat domain-containing protein, partial [Myxococcales bacterium]
SAEAAQQALCALAAEARHDVAVASARMANGRCPVEPILSRLSRGGSETLAALAVLAVTGGAEGAAKVTAQLDSSDEQIRLGAALALASLQAPEAEPKVLKMLSAEAARLVRSRQKWIAGPLPLVEAETDGHGHKHGEDEAGLPPQLASYLAAERERKESFKAMLERVDTLKAARAEAQGIRIVDREEKTPLDVMDDVQEGEIRLLIALERAAGALGSQGAVPILEQLASDPVVAIRAAACGALARTGAQGVERAGACLLDRSLEVVREAARGLVMAGPAAVPVLQEALGERGADRSEIIRALGELKAAAAAPAIAKLLEVGGLESVEAAVALGKLGDRAHVGALATQLADRTCVARLEIIEALGALGDPSAAEALTGELFNERPDIRAAAARALGKVGAGAKTEALSALRFDYYAEVRRAAEEVLGPEGGGP